MILKYRHAGIVVADMEKSIDFYCRLLDHKVLVDFVEKGTYFNQLIGLEGSEARVAKVGVPDGTFVELIHFLNHEVLEPVSRAFNVRGCNHICFTVDHIDEIHSRLEANGIEFVTPPLASSFDPVKTCFCYDPDNTLIQFVEILDPENMKEGLK